MRIFSLRSPVPTWGFRELTPDQQRLWLETFERFHISSVADIRDRYSGQVYRLLGWERPTPDVVLIKSILDYPGRAVDIFIDYRVRERPQGWRIVDVHQPPAVSEVAMRRSEYRTGASSTPDETSTAEAPLMATASARLPASSPPASIPPAEGGFYRCRRR